MVRRGEVWWADLPESRASEPGFTRPVVVIQSDAFNRSRIDTVVVAALSSNSKLLTHPGNVGITSKSSGLPKNSVVNVSQLLTIDKSFLRELVGSLDRRELEGLNDGLGLVLDL